MNRSKRNVDDLLDSYSHTIPNDKKNSVPRRIPPQLNFPNLTETELLEILAYLSKHNNNQNAGKVSIKFDKYFVDSLNDTEKALITADQYEILKLVQGLSTETAKANFMWQLFRCIRSLSFIRCVGIFVWPVIVNNFPSPFRLPSNRNSRAEEEMQIEEILGMSPSDFESELVNRKKQIESNFIEWYKSLTGDKFEANMGPLKVKGHGDGELTVTFSGFREGRFAKIKDNKSLPSILTIISDVIEEVFENKPEKTKNKKESPKKEKRSRSLHNLEESNLQELLRHKNDENNSKRLAKDDVIINMLLEKLKPSVGNIKNSEIDHFFDIGNAYRAFQMLFGPKVSDKITNELKLMSDKNHINQHEYDELKAIDELELVSLEAQEKNLEDKLKTAKPRGRAMYEFEDDVNGTSISRKEIQIKERLSKFKSYLADYVQKFYSLSKKKVQTGLTLRLPKLNDKLVGRRTSSSLSTLSRDLKSKMGQMMPAAGVAVSFLTHLALAHAKAAASVAGLLSNMALGSAMLGLLRDMIFGANAEPKVKYVYENEKHDTSVPWSPAKSDSAISFPPTTKIQGPAPYFSDIY